MVSYKHSKYYEIVISENDYKMLSYTNKDMFKKSLDRPLYKILEEKNDRVSFVPIV